MRSGFRIVRCCIVGYEPVRVQRKRVKGWRMPLCGCGRGKPHRAVYVGRGSDWGNPFVVGKTQVRCPGAENPEVGWELEGRFGKPVGPDVKFYHGDGRVTTHDVRVATASECVLLFREMFTGSPVHCVGELAWVDQLEEARAVLGGHDLACWCLPGWPCHADVLLELVNDA